MKISNEFETYNFIKKAVGRADASFDETEIRECLKAVNRYFNSKYDTNNQQNVIRDFQKLQEDRVKKYGVFIRDDAIVSTIFEDIISNPGKAVDLLLNAQDVHDFASLGTFYTEYDRDRNFNEFVRFIFYNFSQNTPIERYKSSASTIYPEFVDWFKKNMEDIYKKKQVEFKEKLIESIGYNSGFLTQLNSLDDMFAKQNEIYQRSRVSTLKGDEYNQSGLMALALSDEEKESVYSPEYLKDCNIMQLEAILSFLMNRGEKVFERIGTGLYFCYANAIETGKEESIFALDFLKRMWQKKVFFTELSKDLLSKTSSDYEEVQSETGAYYGHIEESKAIEYVKQYSKAYSIFFQGADILSDYSRFDRIIGAGIANRYLGKDKLIESLIIYSDQTKNNWGYTIEKNTKSKDKILLSFDVPGLNMPLRLHAEKKKIANLMSQFFKTNQIPVYCGDEDFIVYGNKVGTQALYPVPGNKVNALKKAIEKKRISPGYTEFANHLKIMHSENSRKRMLKYKLGREYPYYYDLKTGEIIGPDDNPPTNIKLSNISESSKKNRNKINKE